jgi:hypothetical protein
MALGGGLAATDRRYRATSRERERERLDLPNATATS